MYRRVLLTCTEMVNIVRRCVEGADSTRDTHDVAASTSTRVLHLHGVPPVHLGLGLCLRLHLASNILHLRLDAIQRLLGGSHLVVGLVPLPGLALDVPVLVDDGVRSRQPLVILLHNGGYLSPVDFHVFLQVSGLTEAPATGGADVRSLSSV